MKTGVDALSVIPALIHRPTRTLKATERIGTNIDPVPAVRLFLSYAPMLDSKDPETLAGDS